MARPKAYDEQALLNAAMQEFWRRGYQQTSVNALVSRTGVNRASLYAAYPDKKSLFLAAVKQYLDTVSRQNLELLRRQRSPTAAIRSFFDTLITEPQRMRQGCLLTNSAVEFGVTDQDVAVLIRQVFDRVESALAKRLHEAAADGKLRDGLEPQSYARQLVALIQGLRVMARVGTPRPVLRDAIESALTGLL